MRKPSLLALALASTLAVAASAPVEPPQPALDYSVYPMCINGSFVGLVVSMAAPGTVTIGFRGNPCQDEEREESSVRKQPVL